MASIIKDGPGAAELVDGLRALPFATAGVLEVLERRKNHYSSSFASEIVTVRTGGNTRRLFCKHGWDYIDRTCDQRRGIQYESEVYERVLQPLAAPTPEYLGSFRGSHGTTLVMEFEEQAERLHQTRSGVDSPVVTASSLLGRWHQHSGAWLPSIGHDLNVLARGRFEKWRDSLKTRWRGHPALEAAAHAIADGDFVDALANSPQTIIHGELYTSNVLVSRGTDVTFVDWETCAVGPGVIDLAMLTVGDWPDATRRACEVAYVQTLHGGTATEGFNAALVAARLFVLEQLARHRSSGGRDPLADPSFRNEVEAVTVGLRGIG